VDHCCLAFSLLLLLLLLLVMFALLAEASLHASLAELLQAQVALLANHSCLLSAC
jgi:hypothetical protein